MHPVHEYRREVDELRAAVRALTALVNPAQSAAARDAELQAAEAARVAAAEEEAGRRYAAWEVERAAKEEAKQVEYIRQQGLDKHGNPLQPDQYRDDCGTIRDRATGQRVSAAEQEFAERLAVGRIQAQEHRTWKIGEGLAVRPLPDGEEG